MFEAGVPVEENNLWVYLPLCNVGVGSVKMAAGMIVCDWIINICNIGNDIIFL